MKICFLTQTAHDISDYYKKFFRDKDLFFITFKTPNSNALGFFPKSTWSDGRNRLWELVKDKYDYYVFIDDDLLFYNFSSRLSASPILAYLYSKYYTKNISTCFQQAKPAYFLNRLEQYLKDYKPEVLSVAQVDADFHYNVESLAMRKNSFVRRMAHFDAQFTVLSNYAANKLLPYDTKISGWWSSQIPIYLYSYNVFASKAISIVDLGVANSNHVGAYVVNYDGVQDCKRMIAEISVATGRDYSALSGANDNEAVDLHYAEEDMIRSIIPKRNNKEDYKLNFEKSLRGLEQLLHNNLVVQ